MRGIVAGLVVAFVIVLVALLVALVGSSGVAAIGWLLSRWFDLSQWQGSLIALAVALGIGFAIYRLVAHNAPFEPEPEWIDWFEEEEEAAQAEPPVVPWRRRRPTQGELPVQKPAQKGQRPR